LPHPKISTTGDDEVPTTRHNCTAEITLRPCDSRGKIGEATGASFSWQLPPVQLPLARASDEQPIEADLLKPTY